MTSAVGRLRLFRSPGKQEREKAMRRAILMNHGKTVFDGDINTALSGEMLSRLFQYPLQSFERNGRRFVSYG